MTMSLTARPGRAPWVSSSQPDGPHQERVFGVTAGRALVETATVAVAAWIYAAVLYRLWDANARVPIYQDRADARLIANLCRYPTRAGSNRTHTSAPPSASSCTTSPTGVRPGSSWPSSS
ncbi:MAG: hypothetical protein WKF43_04510 [Acidimicrobiales bacterium]